jgi:hypothetical protein
MFTSKYLALFLFTLLLSGKLIAQTTTITSSITIDQAWVNTKPTPWTISGTVTVTFGENFTITNTNQYFIITGSNVTIDGAGKTATISGVTNYPGLVDASASNASSATIKNIGVITIGNTSLSEYQGYISRQSNRAIILNCYSTGAISGNAVGGIAGLFNMGAISNCYTTGAISGFYTGGIAGPINSGTISNCYTRGAISGNYAGGIEGIESSSNISNCYSTGAISRPSFASGISVFSTSSITYTYIGNGTWNSTAADAALIGEDGSIWNTSNTPYTLKSFVLSELTITPPTAPLTSNCAGVPSSSTTFGVNGSGLTTPVIISAPSNFEISTSSSGAYSSSLTLPQASTVSQTLYVRLNSSATFGINSGTITATSTDASDATATVSGTVLAKPTLSFSSISLCAEATYIITNTTSMPVDNGWSVSGTITVNNGYVTAGTTQGTYTVSYTDGCAQTASATVTVNNSDNGVTAIADGLASYKINNTNPIPQGPTASLYVGYNGFNYTSATKPTNTGFYKANNQSSDSAGCPYSFYIFRCTTCPD